jgi:hypothetical protein
VTITQEDVREVLGRLDVTKLEVKKGELLVFRVPAEYSAPQEIDRWYEFFNFFLEARLGHPVPILVVPHGTDLLTVKETP